MLSTESRRGRRIVARLDRGTDLFDGIRSLCQKYRVRCGELRGIGSLEQAELAAFDQTLRRWKPARTVAGGGLELLHLAGNVSEEDGAISIQCQATLMRDRDTGVEMLGGHLRRAVVYSVELVVESFDDLVLRRQADAATGLSRWQEALNDEPAASPAITTPVAAPTGIASTILSPTAPPPKPTPTSTPAPTWSAVAAVSEARREEPNDEEVILNAGDVILHPRFQRCVVHRIEGHGEFVQVMLKNGRVVRLSMEVMRLTPQGIENGQRIFAATIL
jgi:predicted DNA-binding protein with PD1-like motif